MALPALNYAYRAVKQDFSIRQLTMTVAAAISLGIAPKSFCLGAAGSIAIKIFQRKVLGAQLFETTRPSDQTMATLTKKLFLLSPLIAFSTLLRQSMVSPRFPVLANKINAFFKAYIPNATIVSHERLAHALNTLIKIGDFVSPYLSFSNGVCAGCQLTHYVFSKIDSSAKFQKIGE